MDFLVSTVLIGFFYYGAALSLRLVCRALHPLLKWALEQVRIAWRERLCPYIDWLIRMMDHPHRGDPFRRQEKARAGQQHEQRHEQRQQHHQTAAPPGPYEQALMLLGLGDDLTRASFEAAYRRAMMKAHPDRGGTKEWAQALNAARRVIRLRHGW
jgi:IS5 family transposase